MNARIVLENFSADPTSYNINSGIRVPLTEKIEKSADLFLTPLEFEREESWF